MPEKRTGPKLHEPEWLQRSLDRYLAWGLVFMVVLLLAFPLYRLREPTLRADAKASQQRSYETTGGELFGTNCASCHGAQGTGGTAPTLNSKQFLTTTIDNQMALIITGGISGSSMSAWSIDYGGSLTEEQIRQVVTYLRSLEPNAPSVPDWRTGAKAP
jgi:cytochrome c oxidase cbb3-type subunit 3/ubiquinol-cytochrome c reductase cytochrome c subunit